MLWTAAALIPLVCLFGVFSQECVDCKCCKGDNACNAEKICMIGCLDGYWGDKCEQSCPENCKTCESDTNCTECKSGYFTKQCNYECGKGCVNNTCLQSGHCTCKTTSFKDGFCSSCARDDKFGDECNYTCPNNCAACLSQTNCIWCINKAFYGSYCQFKCSAGCNNGTCYKDGSCTTDCKPNFTGKKCDSCVSGKHGRNCDKYCPENCQICFSDTYCTECKLGYYGSICTNVFCNSTKCEDGLYGIDCKMKCQDRDGSCITCLTNESGRYGGCTKCTTGMYPYISSGLNLTKCSFCLDCKNNACDPSNGYCIDGCYTDTKYGNYCLQNCSNHCKNQSCNRTTGQCSNGCEENRYGRFCENESNKHVRQDGHTTSEMIGATFGAVLIGVLIGTAFTFVYITWKRRRNEKKGDEINGNPGDGIEIMATQDRDCSNNVDYENEMPATYEELKERDERTYSQITSNQQMSLQAAEYINC